MYSISMAVIGLYRFILDLNLKLRHVIRLLLLIDPKKDQFLIINLNKIIDDLSNKQPGYSLTHNIRNQHDNPNT